MAVVFEASTSPLIGREGDIVGARQLKERLMREAESNISMRIEELEDKSGVEVAGRGVLHLSVLMETMRREGFEFQVGRPRVLIKKDAVSYTHLDVYKRQGPRGAWSRTGSLGERTERATACRGCAEGPRWARTGREDLVGRRVRAVRPAVHRACLLYTSRCV